MLGSDSSRPSPISSCAVCGCSDARTLSSTVLASGAVVIVCGGHAVAHSRCERPARTVKDLRALLADRRSSGERRGKRYVGEDELARALSMAFTGERRGVKRRTAGA